MGAVYRAVHQRLGKPVAIKLLSSRWTGDARLLARFQQELLAIAQQPIPPIRDRRSDVPQALADVLDKLLAKNPEDRFATSAEVAAGSDVSRLVAGAIKYPAREARAQAHVAGMIDTAASAAIDTHSSMQPGASAPAAGPDAPIRSGGGRRTLVGIAAALVAIAVFVIRLATDYGELVIDSQVPDAEVVVSNGHEPVRRWEVEQGTNTTRLRSGQYEISLAGPVDGLVIDPDQVELRRGDRMVVRVSRVELPGGQKMPRDSVASPVEIPADPLEIKPGRPVGDGALVQSPARLDGLPSWTFDTVSHRSEISVLEFSPDGRLLARIDDNSDVRVWDNANGRLVQLLTRRPGARARLAWSPDSRYLCAGGCDWTSSVHLWDVRRGRHLRCLEIQASLREIDVAWLPSGEQVFVGDAAGSIRAWHADSGELARMFSEPVVRQVAYDDAGHFRVAREFESRLDELFIYVALREDGTQELLRPSEFESRYGWDRETAVLPRPLFVPGGFLGTASRDLRLVASNQPDGTVVVRDLPLAAMNAFACRLSKERPGRSPSRTMRRGWRLLGAGPS